MRYPFNVVDNESAVPTLSPAGKLDDVQRFALSLKMNHLRHDDPPLVEAAKIGELFKLAVGGFVNGRQRSETEALKPVGKTPHPPLLPVGATLNFSQVRVVLGVWPEVK